MKQLLSAVMVLALPLAACTDEEGPDAEACEHLQNGPAVAVTASATEAGAPAVDDDHRRYDVTLVDVPAGGKGGFVTFSTSEIGDYAFFLNADVPLALSHAGGGSHPFHESANHSTACSEVKGRHLVQLTAGTHVLSFGPNAGVSSVGLVIEETVHEH